MDKLLCVNMEGVHEISATKNGAEVVERLYPGTGSVTEFVWFGRAYDNQHISLADGLIDGCPDSSKPLVIIPLDADASYEGAFVKRGARLCVVGEDIVLYDDTMAQNDESHAELNRWPGFTPIF
ncbi:MAG: hypothetical protein WCT28_00175 [Patescibacteria group bacterium]